MKYKLLVLDVDGTLLDSEKKISKRTLAALLKVQQMGVRIVLASGRPTYGLMPIAKALELGNYGGFILSYNGGQIINAQSGELLFERRINPEMLPYLEKKSRKNGFAIFTYHEDAIITESWAFPMAMPSPADCIMETSQTPSPMAMTSSELMPNFSSKAPSVLDLSMEQGTTSRK